MSRAATSGRGTPRDPAEGIGHRGRAAAVWCAALAACWAIGCGNRSIEGAYDQGKPHGLWVQYHPNGQRQKAGNFDHGTPVGVWTTWYASGQRQAEGAFEGGHESGPWTYWHENGQKRKQGSFVDGKEEGHWTLWHQAGQRSGEGEYRAGEQVGVWKQWDEDGTQWLKLCTGSLTPEWEKRRAELLTARTGPAADFEAVLARVAAEGEPALPLVAVLLRSREEGERIVGCKLAGKLGATAGPAADLLTEELRNPNGRTAGPARQALRAIGESGVWAARKALQAGDSGLRSPVLDVLAALGPAAEKASPDVLALLNDPRPDVAREAARTLGALGPGNLAALKKALTDGRPEVRGGAYEGIGLLRPQTPETQALLTAGLKEKSASLAGAAVEGFVQAEEASVPTLIGLFALPELDPVRRACTALSRIGPPAFEPLLATLADPRPEFRLNAATALGLMKQQAAKAVPKLQELASDPDENVRFYAQDALKKIQAKN